MKIMTNGINTIHHLTSCTHSALNSLCTKVKKLWNHLVNLLDFSTDSDNYQLEKVVTMPTQPTEEMDISWTFNNPLEMNEEHIYEEIDREEPIYEEIDELYEEIPAAKGLFIKQESLYDVPMRPIYAAALKNRELLYEVPTNNKLVETKSFAEEPGTKSRISDIESYLEKAKQSMPSKLSLLEGSEIFI